METKEAYLSLGVALGVGFLLGLQREQSNQADPRQSLGGVRTYPLVALAGALCTLLARQAGAWIVGVGFIAILIPVGLAYADDLKRGNDRGITSEMAMLVTYLLGAFATATGLGIALGTRLLLVGSVGVVVMALLSLKGPLHTLARRVSSEDIYATLKFGAIGIILLPLLPNRTYGPLSVLNPFHIGTMIVLIAGIGFVGYIAVRVLGPGKGLGVTGLVGGLVSSTAVTLSFSARAKSEPHVAGACAVGVLLACSIMPIRVILEVAVVHPALVRSLTIPLAAMSAAGLIAAGVLFFRVRGEPTHSEPVPLKNPFELTSAVKFGLIFAVVLFVSKAATVYWSGVGIYLAGLLAGTTDVDAITLSMAKLSREGLAAEKAVTTILIAAASNTIVKGGMALVLGGGAFGRKVALGFVAMILAGAGGAVVLWM